MPRIDRDARLGRHQRNKLGKALLARLDFVNGEYRIGGSFAAPADIFGTSDTGSAYDPAKIVAGRGAIPDIHTTPIGLIGALATIVHAPCTVVVDFYARELGAIGASMWTANAGYTDYRGFDTSGVYGGSNSLGESKAPLPAASQLGLNRWACSLDPDRLIAASVNGSECNTRAVRRLENAIAVNYLSSDGDVDVQVVRFYRPILDLAMLRNLSRI